MSLPRIAIIAAMPGEIRPLVRGWAKTSVAAHGRRLRMLQQGRAFAATGGMGEAIRVVARALVEHAHPDLLISAGWAGSLRQDLKVGAIVVPEIIIEAADRRAFHTYCGAGTLLTTTEVLDAGQKASAAARYSALAIDMEAAAVAAIAQETGTRFMAVKTIFDDCNFPLPPLARFVSGRGSFRYAHFLSWLAVRPGEWPTTRIMRRNSTSSARALAAFLEKLLACDSLTEVQEVVANVALGLPL